MADNFDSYALDFDRLADQYAMPLALSHRVTIQDRKHAETFIGKSVRVIAFGSKRDEPPWYADGEVVTIRGFSPTQPEVWRTSSGPLQWTRQDLCVEEVRGR